MSNAQVFHDPLREDLDYLIDRSRQHDRELKELRGNEEGRRQLEYLQGRAQQHEDKVGRLSEDVSVLAGQPRPWVVRLGNMLLPGWRGPRRHPARRRHLAVHRRHRRRERRWQRLAPSNDPHCRRRRHRADRKRAAVSAGRRMTRRPMHLRRKRL